MRYDKTLNRWSFTLGDYNAISVDDVSVFATHKEAELMPGGHAGLTKEELEIPLIAVCKCRQSAL